MYKSRKIESNIDWLDESGIKIYTISATFNPVEQTTYIHRLKSVKNARIINWDQTAAFAIFHDGENCKYLVLVWWGNDNELFTSVSVKVGEGWEEDPKKYSFCAYDMEVMWAERNIFIKTIDCDNPSLEKYRTTR